VKRFIVAVVVLLAAGMGGPDATTFAQASWKQLSVPGVSADNVRDLVVAPSGDLYVAFDKQGLWRSGDHGETWQSIQYNIPALPAGGFFGCSKQGELLFAPADHDLQGIYRLPAKGAKWIAAAYDKTPLGGSGCPGRLFVNKAGDVICVASANGGNRVLRSTDGGQSFSYTPVVLGGAALFDVKQSPVNADEMAISTETGPEWRSADGGLTWDDIGKSGGDVRLAYNRLGQLFGSATHDSAAKGWLLARWTGGTNWVRSDKGLPPYEDTRSSALSLSSGWMFLGNVGVCVSKDDGGTWQSAGTGFPVPAGAERLHVASLAVDDKGGCLYAGVRAGSSKGVWRLLLELPKPATGPP
jgi:hypothetical protein